MVLLRSAILVSPLWTTSWASSSGSAAKWTSLSNSGNIPSVRSDHSMTVLPDNTVVLFGGYHYENEDNEYEILNDIYQLEVSGSVATWTSLINSGEMPSGRSGHSMTVLVDGTVVLFGGSTSGGRSNDIYQLEVSGSVAMWTSLNNSGDTPAERNGHSMTALADNTAVLFGGLSSGGESNDIFQLVVSGSVATWTSLNNSGDTPSARYGQSMTALADNTVLLFGGLINSGGGRSNDIFQLVVSGSVATWTSLNNSGDTPSARYGQSMTALADNTAVLFGGLDGSVYAGEERLKDIYQLEVSGSVATWTSLNYSGDIPSGRDGNSMTVLADNTVVLFGGSQTSIFFNDIFQLEVLSGGTTVMAEGNGNGSDAVLTTVVAGGNWNTTYSTTSDGFVTSWAGVTDGILATSILSVVTAFFI